MAAPNIVNVATILGETAVQLVGTSAAAIVTNPSSSNKVFKVNTLYVGNTNSGSAVSLTVDVLRSGVAYRLAPAISVPSNSTLDVITKPIYLEEGDSLRLTASSGSSLEAVCSFEEIF